MKIRPVILCGGAGTRLWPNARQNQAKQFIDFGGWTLLEKTLERVKNSLFDAPIISTNLFIETSQILNLCYIKISVSQYLLFSIHHLKKKLIYF